MATRYKRAPQIMLFCLLMIVGLLFSISACTILNVGNLFGLEAGDEPQVEETLNAFIEATISAQQTDEHFQATIASLQKTNEALVTVEVQQPTYTSPPTDSPVDTATPNVQPTEVVIEVSPISITEWDMLYWRSLPSGCHFDEMVCWKLFDDFKTTQGKADAVLTSKDAVFIEETWQSPYLVYWHERELRYTAYMNLRVDGTPITVQDFSKSSGIWTQAFLDLKEYKGKNVIVQFISVVGEKRISSWFIQNVQIIPDFTPPSQ